MEKRIPRATTPERIAGKSLAANSNPTPATATVAPEAIRNRVLFLKSVRERRSKW